MIPGRTSLSWVWVLAMLVKHKAAILVCWLAATMVGIGSYFIWPRTYEVFAQIQLVSSPLASKFEELAARLLLPAEEDIESWMRVVRSEKIIDPALQSIGAITADTPPAAAKKLIEQTRNNITVIRDGTTKIFTIRIVHGDPKFAADIVKAIVEQFQAHNKNTKTMQDEGLKKTVTYYIDRLDKGIEEQQALLESAEKGDAIRKKAGETREEIARLVEEFKNELRKLDEELQALSLRFKDTWPARQQCRMKIDYLTAIVACGTLTDLFALQKKQEETFQSNLAPTVQNWVARQKLLIEKRDRLAEQEKEYAAAKADHAQRTGDTRSAESLTKAIKDDQNLRSDLQQQYKKAEMSIEKTVNDFIVLTRNIIPPQAPVSPDARQFFIIFTLWAIGLSIGVVYLLEAVDRSIHTVVDVQHRTGLDVLAVIPPIRQDRGAAKEKEHALTNFLVFSAEHYSPVADSYRIARINIVSALDKSLRDKLSLLVTSAQPQEGKSMSITNLGSAFAETGAKTVILDCNLRHGMLADYFGVNGEIGMNQVLAGQYLWPEVLQRTPFPGLHLIPAGKQKAATAALIHAPVFQVALEAVREEYDVVLIDTAPALLMADPLLIAPRVDGVVLICASGMTTRELLTHAASQIEKTKGKLLGVLLNHKEAFTSPHYYYYSHYYAKAYGQKKE
ncbi:MAG: polysaccharide biosynthesis tyrosine autokinase [Planctomycetota bacterium]|nr:polysaccharide biosynthesis tyrosine autokinase [Planctomycetota bacterium]